MGCKGFRGLGFRVRGVAGACEDCNLDVIRECKYVWNFGVTIPKHLSPETPNPKPANTVSTQQVTCSWAGQMQGPPRTNLETQEP